MRCSPLRPCPSTDVPVDGCAICKAAHNGRTAAQARNSAWGVRDHARIIEQHPHRRATDEGGGAVDGDVNGDVNGHVNTDAPEGADLTPRSALEFPPCACGHPDSAGSAQGATSVSTNDAPPPNGNAAPAHA